MTALGQTDLITQSETCRDRAPDLLRIIGILDEIVPQPYGIFHGRANALKPQNPVKTKCNKHYESKAVLTRRPQRPSEAHSAPQQTYRSPTCEHQSARHITRSGGNLWKASKYLAWKNVSSFKEIPSSNWGFTPISKNWAFHQRKKHVRSIFRPSVEQIVCRERKEDNSCCVWSLFSLHLAPPRWNSRALFFCSLCTYCTYGSQRSQLIMHCLHVEVWHCAHCVDFMYFMFGSEVWQDMELTTVALATRFSISKGNMMWHTPFVSLPVVCISVPHTVNLWPNDPSKVLLQSS